MIVLGRELVRCPWRYSHGLTVYACGMPSSLEHHIHEAGPGGPALAWREDDPSAFRADVADSSQSVTVRNRSLDRCVNQQCPNEAGEGQMTTTTIRTTLRGAPRDVVLLLCAPCGEYVSRMFASLQDPL